MEHLQSRLGAAAIITNDHGDVLLVHHTYGPRNCELPGGFREPEESALKTVLREETRLAVVLAELAGVYYEPANNMHHFTFRCSTVSGADPEPDQLEISECRFWAIADLPRPMTDFTLRRITDAISTGARPRVPSHRGPSFSGLGPDQFARPGVTERPGACSVSHPLRTRGYALSGGGALPGRARPPKVCHQVDAGQGMKEIKSPKRSSASTET
jgi:8-oxo-dGTP diphosphatase